MSKTAAINSPAKQINLVWLIFLLALIKFILPYIVQNSVYEPHRDEFLYLAEARHMAWGYYEVPPLLSVFAWLTNLFGGSLFWIKFWPCLFGAFTYVLVARLILLFGGRAFALVVGFLPFILGYYVHVNFMFQPNFLEVFFWTLMAYGLVKHVKTGENSGLYIAGIGLGLGLMSKYSVGFFASGLLLGLLLTKERKVLLNKHFYFAMLIGLLIFMPNFIWEWTRGFPIIHQMKDLQSQQLNFVSQASFLIDQLLFNLPCIFTWVAGLYWVSFTAAGKPYRFIGWAVLIALVIIVIGHGKSYYGMGAYPILFGFGAVCLERWAANRLIYLRYTIVIFALGIGCYIDTTTLPFLPPQQLAAYYANSLFKNSGLLKWEDQKNHPLPQDFADMLAWQELAQKTAKVYNSFSDSDKSKTIIDCDNYGEAAAIDYYGPALHLKPVMSHAASYLFWTRDDFYKSDILILTTDDRDEIRDTSFTNGFKSAAIADSITNPYAREYGSYILLLKYPSPQFRKLWHEYYESSRKDMSIFNHPAAK